MTYYSALFFLVLLSSTYCIDPSIKAIQQEYSFIKSNLKNFNIDSTSLDGLPSDDGQDGIAYCYSDSIHNIRLISVTNYFEMGRASKEYYYSANKLIFVFETNVTYNAPYYLTADSTKGNDGVFFDPTKSSIREDRYYLSNDSLILWLGEDKKPILRKKGNYTKTQRALLESSSKLRKFIVK